MKSILSRVIAVLAGFASAAGQSTPPEKMRQRTPMCDLYESPEEYSGKVVSIHGGVFGTDLWIDEIGKGPCRSWTKVVLMLPANDAGLVRDKNFDMFFDELRKGRQVEATFQGRFDVIFVWRNHKRVFVNQAQDKGFGKRHDAGARVVLNRISEINSYPTPPKL